ncbi:hypothetical protein GCM10010168_02390 [Actinoplanes ianthinogenes]|uniref:DUF2231 domain-containing protein n=1 Tax=Actinoplanes ianthinogenes TaxID=122358 RepID=A0ABM7LUN3_9ACTN|nr:DUF2231 domain-containing protein [Actinoplanes ianthinogenes]BCJ43019.1 hypothetical protein Aiant_36760 [Actinoplanes ianthinogenes]GGQ90741.1 hypothetical protein GCM10010168_02390 [Actinoplanes ianthinogenes]
MFDQVNGLPVHALVLHAAVVFVPLLAILAVVYAAVPKWRPRLGWAVALLALAAPISTFVAKESGEQLYNRLVSNGLKGKGLEILNDHMDYGSMLLWFVLGLGVVSLVMVGLTFRPGRQLPAVANVVFVVLTLVLAAGSLYYVFETGDSGATAVWGSY